MISGRRQFIGVLTEALALCLDESLDEPVAQIAVADGYGTCLTEQGRVAVALETEEALDSAEVYLFGLSSGEYGLYYCLELGLMRSALDMKYSALYARYSLDFGGRCSPT